MQSWKGSEEDVHVRGTEMKKKYEFTAEIKKVPD